MSPEKEILSEIDKITGQLYQAISFRRGEKPDLEKFRNLMASDGRLINNNPEPPMILTAEQFIKIYQSRLDSGGLTEFEEKEISHRTELFGKIAQRFSVYESRLEMTAPLPFSRGINSIQFLQMPEGWKVISIIWNDEIDTREIPDRYLPD
jgi:hypothetical protein